MTPKRAAYQELNNLRAQLSWPAMSEKNYQTSSIGVIKNNVELAKAELAKKEA